MSHIHNIIDTDSHFNINPVTREVTTKADKLYVVQYDHDSERFTFQIPRYVEEHDMSLCDRIEIHYTNVIRTKKQQNDDVYFVKDEDRNHDNDTLFFSWLISSNATQLVGTLKFTVTFVCVADNGTITYTWSTAMFENIQVLTKLENAELVREKYPDLYNQLKQDILNSISSSGGSISQAEIEKIIVDYLAANPPMNGEPGADGEDGYSPTIDVGVTESGYKLTITDANGTETVNILHGRDGKDGVNGKDGIDGKDGADGKDGIDGYSPTIMVEDIDGGHRIMITDINGTQTIEIFNGKDGTASSEELKQLVDDYLEENGGDVVVDF